MKTSHPHSKSAFSLIELLVVVAIIGVIVSFTIPAATTMMRGSQLTQSSQLLSDQISYARQLALARNRSTEVRFYKYGDLEVPGELPENEETWRFHSYQIFEVTDNGATLPVDKMQRLPITVVFEDDKYSTLLNEEFGANTRMRGRIRLPS